MLRLKYKAVDFKGVVGSILKINVSLWFEI